MASYACPVLGTVGGEVVPAGEGRHSAALAGDRDGDHRAGRDRPVRLVPPPAPARQGPVPWVTAPDLLAWPGASGLGSPALLTGVRAGRSAGRCGRTRPGARLGRSFSGGAESGVAGSDDGLGAVGDLEFGEDVRDVVADGFRAEVQPAGDIGVAAALSEQRQYFPFPLGQLGERRLLPARIAWKTEASSSNMVRMSTLTSGLDRVSARVASMPLPSGMLRSMISTSGWSDSASSTAWRPVVASPTTWMPGRLSRVSRSPWRIMGWSSAMTTVVGSLMTRCPRWSRRVLRCPRLSRGASRPGAGSGAGRPVGAR